MQNDIEFIRWENTTNTPHWLQNCDAEYQMATYLGRILQVEGRSMYWKYFIGRRWKSNWKNETKTKIEFLGLDNREFLRLDNRDKILLPIMKTNDIWKRENQSEKRTATYSVYINDNFHFQWKRLRDMHPWLNGEVETFDVASTCKADKNILYAEVAVPCWSPAQTLQELRTKNLVQSENGIHNFKKRRCLSVDYVPCICFGDFGAHAIWHFWLLLPLTRVVLQYWPG